MDGFWWKNYKSKQIKIRSGVIGPITSSLLYSLSGEIIHKVPDWRRGSVKMLIFQLTQGNKTFYKTLHENKYFSMGNKNEHVHIIQIIYPQLVNAASDSKRLTKPTL